MDQENYPFRVKRDLRAGAPQPLFRAITDLLDERGFRVVSSEPPELMPGALPGTASFKGYVLGVKDDTVSKLRHLRAGAFLAVGLALAGVGLFLLGLNLVVDRFFLLLGSAVGVILALLGIGQFRELANQMRHVVEVRLEGESYQAGASGGGPGASWGRDERVRVERAGIVSDVRVTLSVGIGIARGDSGISRWLPRREAEVVLLPLPLHLSGKQAAAVTKGLELRLDRQMDMLVDRFALPEGRDTAQAESR